MQRFEDPRISDSIWGFEMRIIRRCPLIALLPLAFVLAACSRPAESPPASTPATPAVVACRGVSPFATRPTSAAGLDRTRVRVEPRLPDATPVCDSPWLRRNVDFNDPRRRRGLAPTTNGAATSQDIVNYVKQGQDPDLRDEIGWRSEVGGSARWFHVPWMAYDGERGREFVHGLTNELSTAESAFIGPGRGTGLHHLPGAARVNGVDPLFETWSVGFYNACGAVTLGQGWPASGEPATYNDDKGRLLARGMPFPEGTVVVKILNTTADETVVPYLKGSTSWQANAPQADRFDVRDLRTCGAARAPRADGPRGGRFAFADALGLQHPGLRRHAPGQDRLGSHEAARRAVGQRSRAASLPCLNRRASRCARRC